MATVVSNDSNPSAVVTSGTGSTAPTSDAMPNGSLTALPGGSSVSGNSTVIPQAVLDAVSSNQVTSTKYYVYGAIAVIAVGFVIYFAFDKAGSVIDIAEHVAKKL